MKNMDISDYPHSIKMHNGVVTKTSDCLTIETSYCVKKFYDDGSFSITQNVSGPTEKYLTFGPLTISISDMFKQFYWLEINGTYANRQPNVYPKRSYGLKLVNNEGVSYTIAKPRSMTLSHIEDLTECVSEKSGRRVVEVIPSETFRDYMFIHGETANVKRNPLDMLLETYPVDKKPVEFIGNQTLHEYVKTQLIMQRKLENV